MFGLVSAVDRGFTSRKGHMRRLSRHFSFKKSGSDSSSQDDSRTVSDSDHDTGDFAELRTTWSYEKVAATPVVAEAFQAFACVALCQESVMFLEEVSKYEKGDYTIAWPAVSQFAAFNHIIERFFAEGAVDEINISFEDKKRLISKNGSSAFLAQTEEQRRLVFKEAFIEIRHMLENNLLHRFLRTEKFRSILSEAALEPFE